MKIKGFCPFGCGETLFIGTENRILCSKLSCPQPEAVDMLLQEAKETRHIVNIVERGSITIQHPVMERCGGELFSCTVTPRLFIGTSVGRYYYDDSVIEPV